MATVTYDPLEERLEVVFRGKDGAATFVAFTGPEPQARRDFGKWFSAEASRVVGSQEEMAALREQAFPTQRQEAKLNYRDEIAQEIIARIEAGTAPWQKPWKAGTIGAAPFNPISGKPYRGINDVWLTLQGRADPRWLTYNQAVAEGGQVRKGEKSTTIEYWQWTAREPVVDGDGKPVLGADGQQQTQEVRLDRPRVFYAKVFNAEQVDGLAPWVAPAPAMVPLLVTRAEAMISSAEVPVLHDQRDRAFYTPSRDEIHLPPVASFNNIVAYYETALHELGHATGHPTRLARSFGPFGSEGYAREELRAEISSYMLARDLGISFDPSNHAAYVESWLKVLREDRNEIFRAAKDAETIKVWVMEPEKRPELERAARQQAAAQTRADIEAREASVRQAVPAMEQTMPKKPENRTYIAVPFGEKNEAKNLGARWDRTEKSWYIPTGSDPATFAKWTEAKQPPEPEKARGEVLSVEEYERRIMDTLKSLPEGYHYLTVATAEYLGFSTQRTAYADGIARVWNTDKLTAGEADLLLTRTAIAGNWPVKAAEAMGLADGLPDLTTLAGHLRHVDWDHDYSDDYKVRQEASARISAVTKAAVALVATSHQHAELASVVWDKLAPVNSRAPERRFDGYVPSDQRTTDLVIKLAGDPFAATLAAHGMSAELVRQMEAEKAPEKQPTPEQPKARTYLAVPFAEKDEVKKLGAHWDRKEKAWYIGPEQDPAAFAKWSMLAPSPALTPEEEFAQTLKTHGLELDGSPEMDGEWHRVRVAGDKGKETSGMYRGFLDGRPAGNITNYKAGKTTKWVYTGMALTDEERARVQASAAQVRADRDAKRLDLAEQAAKTAYGIWANLPASASPQNCPYLAGKGVGGYGVKVNSEGQMVVPCRDDAGKLWNVQFVDGEGKHFLKDSRKAGTMHVIEPSGTGTLDSLTRYSGTVVIVEGYATGSRIYESVHRPVVVAFDSGNLLAVAEAVQAKYPDRPILIAADNDHANKMGNVGMLKAEEAAKAVDGVFVAPRFSAEEMARGFTDFDDLGKARGNGAVRGAIEPTLARIMPPERSIA